MLKKQGFDEWSKQYDEYVQKTKGYPFEGYNELMNEIISQIDLTTPPNILDIGIGTGTLSSLLNNLGANITGVDFSSEMIKIAKSRIKNGIFYAQDLNKGLPNELNGQTFDYIISTYVIHHFELDHKIEMISKLINHLKSGGKMLIGDVAFKTETDLLECKNISKDRWDSDELYMTADEMIEKLTKKGIKATYKQMSSCAGLLTIEN